MTEKEKNKRINEVKQKGVYFHASTISGEPMKREDADTIIEQNMDSIIGNKNVHSPEETIRILRNMN